MSKQIQLDSSGWIKLHRKIESNAIFSSEWGLKIWIWCLLKAGHTKKDVYFGLTKIHLLEGQFIFGRESAGKQLHIKPSTLRNWMEALKKDSYIDIKPTNKYSIVTVLNWNKYQTDEQQKGQQPDNNLTTDGQQPDTNNKDNKDDNIVSKDTMVKNQYGNQYINFVLEEFKKQTGYLYLEEDKKARMIAYNIYQITNTFIKNYGKVYEEKRKIPATFRDLIIKAWITYKKNQPDHLPLRLITFKQHYRSMLYQLSVSLQKV